MKQLPVNYHQFINIIARYRNEEYFFWFDSSLLDAEQGRYSYATWGGVPTSFEDLKFDEETIVNKRFPFIGGYVSYLTYDLGAEMEGILSAKPALGYPYSAFVKVDWCLAYDHQTEECFLFGEKLITTDIEDQLPILADYQVTNLNPTLDYSEYQAKFDQVIEQIKLGNIYQVNLTYPYIADFSGDTFSLYLKLREVNSAFYSAYLKFGNLKVLSSSPELFLKKRGAQLRSCPIKGTRRRGSNVFDDNELENELFQSEKDNSELIMIVDLVRNDLSRICSQVSNKYDKLIKKFSTVQHLVCEVSGHLETQDLTSILEAVFPGGSITGAPKISAMQIIERLENSRRGIYTGAIGYFSRDFDFDLSIAIRTLIIENERLTFSVGSGITANSVCLEEFLETKDKAQGIINAL